MQNIDLLLPQKAEAGENEVSPSAGCRSRVNRLMFVCIIFLNLNFLLDLTRSLLETILSDMLS